MRRQTDNTSPSNKLELRRYFLNKYHRDDFRVFDACSGEGLLWSRLRQEYRCQYFGVDIKKFPGKLKVDSVRLLKIPGWKYDVIDIDTYGWPWKHWLEIIKNGRADVTVFLTSGSYRFGPGVGGIKYAGIVFPKWKSLNPPVDLLHRFDDYGFYKMLAEAYNYGWKIKEVQIIERAKGGLNLRYIGIRLEKTHQN